MTDSTAALGRDIAGPSGSIDVEGTTMIRRVSSVLIAVGLMAHVAQAQALNPPTQPNTTANPFDPNQAATPAPPAATPAPSANQDGAHRSIVRHNPLPRRPSYSSYHSGYSGYTTGGVGRYAERYDSDMLNGSATQHEHRAAGFDQGAGPNRAEQLEAQQVGNARAAQLQNHIDNYGRPIGSYGFGYGLGLGYGNRLYTYPY